MRICEMFHLEQELDPAKFIELAAEAYQLAFNALEASNELHRLDSVERVNIDLDTNTHTTVPPTATDAILNRHALRPSKQYWITCLRKLKSEF